MTQMFRPALSTEDILRAAGILQKARPAYGALIDFYGQVFVAQAQSLSQIQLDPIILDPGLLALKQEHAMPLIDPSQFLIDKDQAESLFKQICTLAVAHAPKLSHSGERLSEALICGDLDLAPVFAALLSDQDLEPMAKKLDIPADELTFFAFSAMAPSIQFCSAQLSAYLKEGPEFKKGYCPVCGSHPDTAFLDQDGKRFLLCSLCSHEWLTLRMGCVSCDTADKQDQQYFFSAEEKEYRVYVCDNCHHYLKLVDLRQLDRAFVPKLEQITTLHLDYKAQEKGYTGPVSKIRA
ncbi:MAG: formate dehydrogenase accessory protein FdhE [Proteobacteria bacterium]|nr:formate dehydrogenase accessory protein FdhE [Desulfobacula sp.]MBU3951326.1 formate dehydrogenase accessory protein FdhE [Pseudomonadota bacterium]MBU4130361.1 formate dehydrogenase accessory protein FdhE [Pseudomonadota bacterium]